MSGRPGTDPMKRFLPYFKYLRKVRGALAGGVLCGILYGAAGGLGIPLMIKYVVPRVLLPDPVPVRGAGAGGARPRPGRARPAAADGVAGLDDRDVASPGLRRQGRRRVPEHVPD